MLSDKKQKEVSLKSDLSTPKPSKHMVKNPRLRFTLTINGSFQLFEQEGLVNVLFLFL